MDRVEIFAERVDALVRGKLSEGELVQEIGGLVGSLVRDRGWLRAPVSVPVPGKPYSQYLLHLSSDASWSMVSFVWPKGSATPVHDHGCWGVVGVYEGEETETGFRLLRGDRERGRVALARGATRTMRPGDVATIRPPEDVHQVSNHGAGAAISIHVYGADIGRMRRHSFDPATGRVSAFVSGYDTPQE